LWLLEDNMAGKSWIWAIRMPGGPTKIVMSDVGITEAKAKAEYRASLPKTVASTSDRDKSIEWPLVEAIDEQTLTNKYSNFLHPHSSTGRSQFVVDLRKPK
jgi:hypothetical protein